MYSLVFILFMYSQIYYHPVHVSITNIDINSELMTAEISYQFFTDDFERIIQINEGKELVLEQDKELTQEGIDAINNYIFSVFEIKLNNDKKISIDFQYKKQDEALIWLHYKGQLPIPNIDNITMVNNLMMDLYEDQTNLVIVSFNGKEKGYTFNYRKRIINVEL